MATLNTRYRNPNTAVNEKKSGKSWLMTQRGLQGISGRSMESRRTERVISNTPGVRVGVSCVFMK